MITDSCSAVDLFLKIEVSAVIKVARFPNLATSNSQYSSYLSRSKAHANMSVVSQLRTQKEVKSAVGSS